MTIVDTQATTNYSPLIPAIKAICLAQKGEEIRIIMNQKDSFQDLKEYLSEEKTGFREIYDEERYILEFCK